MASILSWNIRGLNWPNKQEDVRSLYLKEMGLIGLLETKVKEKNVHSTATRSFLRWQWIHNFSYNTKGRIWIAWRPSAYRVDLVNMTAQMIHCHVTKLQRNKHFFITFVYGMNQDHQRLKLWQDLQDIASQMTGAWCVLGDFNSVLYKDDRIGGQEITDLEIKDFAQCLEVCELTEMRSTGAYFTWTNKTIWSRLGRVFTNQYWYLETDFTQAAYLSNGLLDHTPIQLQFHDAPKPQATLQYYLPVLHHVGSSQGFPEHS